MKHLSDYKPFKDNIHDDAEIINKAIRELGRGDTLVIDDGEYICSTIFLKSNITIYLSNNAHIKMINNIDLLYDIKRDRDTNINIPTYETCEYDGKPSKYFIYGLNLVNVKICGYGRIDGNEEIFYGKVTKYHIEGAFYPRVPLVYIENGKNISIEGITLERSAFWTLHLVGCNYVYINGLKIKNNPIVTNCDGIDPDHCKNVSIKNCDISCADDCIVIKNTESNKNYGDTYNIHVENCVLKSTSSAIKIGTETEGNFNNISFNRVKIYDSNRGISIMNRDGASIEKVRFEEIDIDTHLVSPKEWWGKSEIIYISNVKRNESSKLGVVKDIIFDKINAVSENGIVIYGESISNVVLKDLRLKRISKTDWPKEKVDLRPSIYGVIDGSFHDLYSKGCRDITYINTNLKDILVED